MLDVARSRTSVRLPVGNLARFELDRPWAQIRFGPHEVDFGVVNDLTRELYVRSGDHVYAVSQSLAAAVPGTAAKLLAHRLFGPDEVPIAFTLGKFSLRHDGTRWLLDPHDPGLSQDDLVRWVEQWRHASSVVTQPSANAAVTETVAIELRDTRKIAVGVVARVPELVLLRDDEALQYHLPAHLAAPLLSSPGASSTRAP